MIFECLFEALYNAKNQIPVVIDLNMQGRITSGSMMPSSLSLEDLIDLKERRDFSEGSRLRVAKNDSLSSESHAECLCRVNFVPVDVLLDKEMDNRCHPCCSICVTFSFY